MASQNLTEYLTPIEVERWWDLLKGDEAGGMPGNSLPKHVGTRPAEPGWIYVADVGLLA